MMEMQKSSIFLPFSRPKRQNLGGGHMLKKAANYIGILGFWALAAGCATHTSLREYGAAKDRLEMAKKANPLAPDVADAELALNQGKRQMDQAQYDQAIRSFRLSMRSSDDAIQKSLDGKHEISAAPSAVDAAAAAQAQVLQNQAGQVAPPSTPAPAVVVPQELKT